MTYVILTTTDRVVGSCTSFYPYVLFSFGCRVVRKWCVICWRPYERRLIKVQTPVHPGSYFRGPRRVNVRVFRWVSGPRKIKVLLSSCSWRTVDGGRRTSVVADGAGEHDGTDNFPFGRTVLSVRFTRPETSHSYTHQNYVLRFLITLSEPN